MSPYGEHAPLDTEGRCTVCRKIPDKGPCPSDLKTECAGYDKQIDHLMGLRREALQRHGVE